MGRRLGISFGRVMKAMERATLATESIAIVIPCDPCMLSQGRRLRPALAPSVYECLQEGPIGFAPLAHVLANLANRTTELSLRKPWDNSDEASLVAGER